jgi:hypothetical protein
MLFERLPDVLVVEVMTVWLDFKAVTKLDSSMTNKVNRPMILEILSCDVSFELQTEMNIILLDWLVLRDVKISSLNLSACNFDRMSGIFSHDINCSKILKISTNHTIFTKSMADIVNRCQSLRVISFPCGAVGNLCEENIRPEILNNLTEYGCAYSEDMETIVKHCKQLEHIELSTSDDDEKFADGLVDTQILIEMTKNKLRSVIIAYICELTPILLSKIGELMSLLDYCTIQYEYMEFGMELFDYVHFDTFVVDNSMKPQDSKSKNFRYYIASDYFTFSREINGDKIFTVHKVTLSDLPEIVFELFLKLPTTVKTVEFSNVDLN